MNMKKIYRNTVVMIAVASIPLFLLSCERVKDDMDDCGVYLEFIYDYNMEYADSFDPQVGKVDVFVFDAQGRYLFAKQSRREDLIGGKRMLLGVDLPSGKYKVLAIGGLSDSFTVSDADGNAPVPGQTMLEEVEIALVHQTETVSHEFSSLWVGAPLEFDFNADLVVSQVHLIKDTNRFNLELAEVDGDGGTRANAPDYTFEISTSEPAVYHYDNEPFFNEPIVYRPYFLDQGDEPGELSAGRINTMRLIYGGDYFYRLAVNDNNTGRLLWDYDLLKLLKHIKPSSRPDGTALPMQEFLDRQSEWHIVILYKEVIGGPEGFLAVGVKVNGWILWLNEIGL